MRGQRPIWMGLRYLSKCRWIEGFNLSGGAHSGFRLSVGNVIIIRDEGTSGDGAWGGQSNLGRHHMYPSFTNLCIARRRNFVQIA